MRQIKSISFIGSGNVATHLALALWSAGLRVMDVFSLHKNQADRLALQVGAKPLGSLAELNRDADLYVLAVPDKTVEEIAYSMPLVDGIVVHTSGMVPLNTLGRFKNHGVFYPLQTFTKERKQDISQVPFCLEAGSENVLNTLKDLAGMLSGNVFVIDSEQRKYLHLAAVFVNNYANYLYGVAYDILDRKNIDTALLTPLIGETIAKIGEIHPARAQTGPARRKDLSTISEHLALLEEFPQYKELYRIFTEQIIKKHHE